MNVAKNKKSAFINLFNVIENLTEEESEKFSNLLKEKRKTTKNRSFYLLIRDLINKEEFEDSINENEVKKKVEKEISNNFNKLTENLYSRLLSFLSDEFKSSELSSWEVEANDRLYEIEALCSRKLYSQATSHLLKLEKHLKSKGYYNHKIFDNIAIYSRLANLKINLKSFSKGLIDEDATDKILVGLLMLGRYFYDNNLNIPNLQFLKKSRYIGYQLLGDYFERESNFELAIDAIEKAKKNISDEVLDSSISNWVLDYLELKKVYLSVKHTNKIPYKSENRINKSQNNVLYLMLQEDIFKHIKTANSPHTLFEDKSNDVKYITDLLFYTDLKIKSIPDRLEMNRAILHYIKKEYDECQNILKELKSKKRNKDRGNSILQALLFLELLCKIQKKDYELSSLFRSLKSCIKHKENNVFEQKAIKLLEQFSKMNLFMREDFQTANKEGLALLEKHKDVSEPIHSLIVFTLKNEL